MYSVFPTKPAEVSSIQDLFEFICSGPLLNKLGMTSEMVSESIDKWLAYGLHLCRLFQLNELYLTIPQKARFYHYYIPVFLWCEQQISDHSSTFKDGEDVTPLVVNIRCSNHPFLVLEGVTFFPRCDKLLSSHFVAFRCVLRMDWVMLFDIFFVMQIGFSAPQGCGKTTLVFALDYLFQVTGR